MLPKLGPKVVAISVSNNKYMKPSRQGQFKYNNTSSSRRLVGVESDYSL